MDKTGHFNCLLETGEDKVPHSFVMDILIMLYDRKLDAKVIKVNENYSKMVLI